MKINEIQEKLVVFCLGALAVTGIFPPWLRIMGQNGIEKSIGFSSIFVPPEAGIVQIDYCRLALLWIVIVMVSAVAFLMTAKKGVNSER